MDGQPRSPTDWASVAGRYFEAGRYAEALELCRGALRGDPDDATALHLQGLILFKTGQGAQAIAMLDRAAQLQPNPIVFNNLGEAYRGLGKLDDAERCYRRALDLDPDYAEARANLNQMLNEEGKLGDPASGYLQLGTAQALAKRFEEAEQSFRQAVALSPNVAPAHVGLGHALEALGRLAEAEESARRAVALAKDSHEAHHLLAVVLYRMLRLDEAEHHFRRALALAPDFANARFCYSLLLLLRGDYETAWPMYEARFDAVDLQKSAGYAELLGKIAATPRWKRGEPPGEKALLVWAEQGAGDNLMALRFLPFLREHGAKRVILRCEPNLARIARAIPGVDAVLSKNDPLPLGEIDRHCPMMSLPWMFGTRLATIPNRVPYVSAPEALRQRWRRRLVRIAAPRVGLCWAGNRQYPFDRWRSIPLERLAPLLGVPGAAFVNLQKDKDDERLLARWGIRDWMDECEDFLDTAALISELDLVVSVDTAIAHLAGALGTPVWLLNRYDTDWRWLLDREDSPWYPTMRIFRQRRHGDWNEPIARAAEALRALVGAAPQRSWWARLFA